MNLKKCEEIARLLTENFRGKTKAYIFGSTARIMKGEKTDPMEEAFRRRDLDFLLEVSPEVFEKYCYECRVQGVHFLNGAPDDPMACYWEYHSPKAARMNAVIEVLEVKGELTGALVTALSGSSFDVIFLPFNWQENKDVLDIINYQDPKFSKNLQKDAILLFEK